MSTRIALVSTLSLALLAAVPGRCTAEPIVADHRSVEACRDIPAEALRQARGLGVVFGHQSVGANLLEGFAALMEEDAERYEFTTVSEPDGSWTGEAFAEFAVGENEDPTGKIRHFREKLDREGLGKRAKVAMMKLCYVDFTEDVGRAKAIFGQYRDTLEGLEKKFPDLRMVWWTAPLMEGENAARNEFNRLVREHCKAKGKALFDLADIEAHDAKGKPHGEPSLCPAWSEDGGHLNDAGKKRAAQGMWWLLARLADWDGKPAARR